jgi:hypothetical protein
VSHRASPLALIALSLAVSGCTQEAVRLSEGTREYVSTDYDGVLRRWTRTAELTTHDKHQFYVALQAQKYKWNDLNAEQPAWIVRLIDDTGMETAPSEIQTIRKPGAIELTYFPYTSPWRSAFRISFPRVRADGRPTIPGAARWFGLRFAGPQGNQEIVWLVERG